MQEKLEQANSNDATPANTKKLDGSSVRIAVITNNGRKRMINKTAFAALSLIMAVAWAFGIVCDRLLTRWFHSLSEPQDKPERRACDTCKYEYTNPKEYPCNECAEDDMDLWEATDEY